MSSHAKKPEALGCILPATGYVRQSQLIPGIVPVSGSTWWRWVKSGKAPKPVKLSDRVTVWRVEDIRAFINSGGTAAAS